jgi:sugar lactone lactonase YvrE
VSGTRDYGAAGLVLDARAACGECPLWSVAEQALYWIDIEGRAIHRFDPASGRDERWEVPSEPGSIALAAQGGLVAALREGFVHFDPRTGRMAPIAAAPYDRACIRFNDGRCDAEGRFWVGTMFEPRTEERGAMYCLERGVVREAWGPAQGLGVRVSNGLAFGADGATVYQSDTPSHVIYRFERDRATGAVSNRRVFARLPGDRGSPGYGGRPDGAALDSEGGYWSAQYEGGRVLRLGPGGEVAATLSVPALRPTMVAFGGSDLRTLYVTSARAGAGEDELARFPLSGGLFACRVDVAGRPEPAYLGAHASAGG